MSNEVSLFMDVSKFEQAQRVCTALVKSSLVPDAYQNNLPNALIAFGVAHRLNADPFMIMQNLHIIKGKPSFASSFLIGLVNSSGRFSPIRYEETPLGKKTIEYQIFEWVGKERRPVNKKVEINDFSCTAYAKELTTGEILKSTPVTLEMAYRNGWVDKPESKWIGMAEQMARYRSAAYWVRIYAPELAAGMPTSEEAIYNDGPEPITENADAVIIPTANPNEKLRKAEPVAEPVPTKEPEPTDDEPLFEDVEHESADAADESDMQDGGLFDDDDKPEI